MVRRSRFEPLACQHDLNSRRGQVHPNDAIPPRRALFRRAGEAVEAVGDCHIAKSGRGEDLDELCFQQSAGNSTGPEIDIAERFVRQHFADDDVGDLHAAGRFEDA